MSLDDKKEANRKAALKSYHKNKDKLREKNLELINSDLQKKCPKCEILFPIAEFITPSGFKHPYCKKCTSIYKRTRYKESDIEKEKVKKRDEKYRKNNYEKIKAYQDAYREKHRTELNEKAAIYRDNNREKIRESQKQYYQNNPEKVKASLKNSYLKRRQRMKEDPEYAHYQYEKQRRNSRRSTWCAISIEVLQWKHRPYCHLFRNSVYSISLKFSRMAPFLRSFLLLRMAWTFSG